MVDGRLDTGMVEIIVFGHVHYEYYTQSLQMDIPENMSECLCCSVQFVRFPFSQVSE